MENIDILLKARKRSVNFSEQNKKSFFNIIKPYIDTLENKRTDKTTSNLKSKAWQSIMERYNLTNTPDRNRYQLKAFYEANKRKNKLMNTSKNIIKNESDMKIIKIEKSTDISSTAKNSTSMHDDNNQNSTIDLNQPNSLSLKCVDLTKLKDQNNVSLHNSMAKQLSNNSKSAAIITKTQQTSTTSSLLINEDINKIRFDILNDDRQFRIVEHSKRMEYMDLSISVLKSHLARRSFN